MRSRSPIAISFAVALAACGPETPEAPTPPLVAAPADPVLLPCPAGWREARDPRGPVTCDPWPDGGALGCAGDEAHLPGAPGCARLGTECPADGWPADLPADRPIVYVDDDAALGGDGASRATALRTIGDAVLFAPEGAIVAVATGRYEEHGGLGRGQTLWGACVAGTVLASAVPSEGAGVVVIGEPGITVQNLSIDASARRGIEVYAAGAVIRDVAIRGATWVGITVWEAGAAEATRVVVQRTQLGTDGATGRGISVTGGSLVLSSASIEESASHGIFARDGGSIEVRDSVVRGAAGRGIQLQAGASAVLERVVVDGTREMAIFATADSRLTGRDLVMRGTLPRADGQRGWGLGIELGSQGSVERATIEGAHERGAHVFAAGSRLELRDVVVRDTLPRGDGEGGRGVEARDAPLVLERVAFVGNHDFAVFAQGAGAIVDLRDLVVSDTSTVDGSGGGVWAQVDASVTIERARIEDVRVIGVLAMLGSTIVATDLGISGVAPASCGDACPDRAGGFGIVAQYGGVVTATHFESAGAALCGCLVGRAAPTGGPTSSLDLATGIIDRVPVGACVQVEGYDTARLRNDVEYRDVGIPLQATSYALPTAPAD